MADPRSLQLGRRERQVVEAVYRLNEASVAQVLEALSDAPSYSTVRAILNMLVSKNVLKLRRQGNRCLYRPVASKEKTGRAALRNLVRNFFRGEPLDAVTALLDGGAGPIAPEDLDKIRRLIDQPEEKS